MSTLTVQNIQGSSSSSNTISVASGHVLHAPGHVIQVKQGILAHASGMNTTSTSYVDTGLQVLITPSSSSNKILISSSFTLYNSGGHNMKITATRNHSGISETDLATNTNGGFSQLHTPTAAIGSGGSFSFLDSPSTTNEITYKIRAKVSGGTGYFSISGDSLVQVMEIAG
tara:strand:- start:295 stop:807 length:513 start_codon:yes stop_codon:yes gene_type:complete